MWSATANSVWAKIEILTCKNYTSYVKCEISLPCSVNRKQYGFFGVFGINAGGSWYFGEFWNITAVFIQNTPRNRAISYENGGPQLVRRFIIGLMRRLGRQGGLNCHLILSFCCIVTSIRGTSTIFLQLLLMFSFLFSSESFLFCNLVPRVFRLATQKGVSSPLPFGWEEERPWERGCLF